MLVEHPIGLGILMCMFKLRKQLQTARTLLLVFYSCLFSSIIGIILVTALWGSNQLSHTFFKRNCLMKLIEWNFVIAEVSVLWLLSSDSWSCSVLHFEGQSVWKHFSSKRFSAERTWILASMRIFSVQRNNIYSYFYTFYSCFALKFGLLVFLVFV